MPKLDPNGNPLNYPEYCYEINYRVNGDKHIRFIRSKKRVYQEETQIKLDQENINSEVEITYMREIRIDQWPERVREAWQIDMKDED